MDPTIAGLVGTLGGLVVGAVGGEWQASRRARERDRETRLAWERQAEREDLTWVRDSQVERYSRYLSDAAEFTRVTGTDHQAEQQAFGTWRTASAALDLTAPDVVKRAAEKHAQALRNAYAAALFAEIKGPSDEVTQRQVAADEAEKKCRTDLVVAMRMSLGLSAALEDPPMQATQALPHSEPPTPQ